MVVTVKNEDTEKSARVYLIEGADTRHLSSAIGPGESVEFDLHGGKLAVEISELDEDTHAGGR